MQFSQVGYQPDRIHVISIICYTLNSIYIPNERRWNTFNEGYCMQSNCSMKFKFLYSSQWAQTNKYSCIHTNLQKNTTCFCSRWLICVSSFHLHGISILFLYLFIYFCLWWIMWLMMKQKKAAAGKLNKTNQSSFFVVLSYVNVLPVFVNK